MRPGDEINFTVTADDNILPLISTKHHGGLLRIDTEESFSTDNEIRIEIDVPQLSRAEVNGSGIIDIRDMTKNDVDFTANWSGEIHEKAR